MSSKLKEYAVWDLVASQLAGVHLLVRHLPA